MVQPHAFIPHSTNNTSRGITKIIKYYPIISKILRMRSSPSPHGVLFYAPSNGQGCCKFCTSVAVCYNRSVSRKNIGKNVNLGLSVISLGRKLFRNTPVHSWKITNVIYRFVFTKSVNSSEKVKFKSLDLVVDPTDITIVPTLHTGEYEKSEIDFFSKCLKPGDVVIDIGANIGIYSLVASKIVGESGKVLAVEAVPKNQEILCKNIKLNSAHNVEVINAAASDKADQTLKIYIQKGSMGTHSAVKSGNDFIVVNTVSLDSVTKSLNKVDVVKIDVEGYEAYVFKGGMNVIQKYKPTIFVEYDQKLAEQAEIRVEEFLYRLKELYKYSYVVDEKKVQLTNLDKTESLPRNSNLIFTNIMLSY
jgi:FkbM family methyltransferase